MQLQKVFKKIEELHTYLTNEKNRGNIVIQANYFDGKLVNFNSSLNITEKEEKQAKMPEPRSRRDGSSICKD